MKKAILALAILTVLFSFPVYSQYQLKFEPEIGKTYPMKISINTDIGFVVLEKELTMNQKMVIGYTFDIDSKDNKDDYLVTTTNRSFTHEYEMMGNKMTFSSFDTNKSVNPMTKLYMALLDKPYQLKIGEDGEIREILHLDEIYHGMLDSINPDNKNLSQMKDQFLSQFGEDYFKSTFNAFFDIYPTKPVNIGDSWTKEILMKTPFEMINKNTYTLVSVSNDTALIEFNSEITMNPDSDSLKLGNMVVKVMMNGTQEGTILMDTKTGWVIKRNTKQELSGQMRMPGEQMNNLPSAWPMKVNTEIVYEPYDL